MLNRDIEGAKQLLAIVEKQEEMLVFDDFNNEALIYKKDARAVSLK